MEVPVTTKIRLPKVQIESVIFDADGNADVVLSLGGAQAKCRIDAGSGHGTFNAALLFLAQDWNRERREGNTECPNTSSLARQISRTM